MDKKTLEEKLTFLTQDKRTVYFWQSNGPVKWFFEVRAADEHVMRSVLADTFEQGISTLYSWFNFREIVNESET